MKTPIFIDTTLRDGEQAPGVAFTLEEKIRLAQMLDEVGVDEIEAGIPAMGRVALSEMQAITSLGLKCKTLSWCRAMLADIKEASKANTNGVHLSLPLSEKLLTTMGKSHYWVLSQLRELVAFGLDMFEYVSIGAQDASRTDHDFLKEFALAVEDSGACRLRLADTVGLLNPFTSQELVRVVKDVTPNLDVEFHAHNDLGMACANSLAAWMAGAESISTTVNGLGERAGNAALEEVALAFEKSANVKCNLQKRVFPPICRYVEDISRRKNSLSKPIVGEVVLTHESDIHTKCMIKDRSSYQLISAADLGLEESAFRIGKHTGASTMSYILQSMGCKGDIATLRRLTDTVREICTAQKRDMQPLELVALYNRFTES
ncbi:MAG: pyruvate carboxyltransferase [Rikenellaceae bacterium]